MAIVVTESDCDFLQKTYNPTGKVEMRVKSILVKLASGFIEFNKDAIKNIEINGEDLTKTKNRIVLGALANTDYHPAHEDTVIDKSSGMKYVPVLGSNDKIPSKYIPATVITDVYAVENVNTWLDVFEELANKNPEPEKGDLIIIASSEDPNMIGNYFLQVDLVDILKEIKDKNISKDYSKEVIDGFFMNREQKLVVKLAEPLGHLTSININGKSYRSENGIVDDIPNVINKITGNNQVEVQETLENGILTSTIKVKEATDKDLGLVKISDEITTEEESIVSTSIKLLKSVKNELELLIQSLSDRVLKLEKFLEEPLPQLKAGEPFSKTIAHEFGKYCDVSIFIKETGEQIFTKIEKLDGKIRIPSLKADKDYAEGDLVLVIKP